MCTNTTLNCKIAKLKLESFCYQKLHFFLSMCLRCSISEHYIYVYNRILIKFCENYNANDKTALFIENRYGLPLK